MDPKPQATLTLPAAIIIAATLIAVAIIYVKKPVSAPAVSSEPTIKEVSMAPVTPADHILGNPDAVVKIVEYSDPSCPFCKVFHPTMKQIMDEYGPSGKVAWVYRHFPLDKHPNAKHEAQSMECAASLGGNDAFWKYTNRLYEVTPSDEGLSLDQKELPNIAKYVGLDVAKFNDCLASGRFADKVDKQYLDGINAMLTTRPEERGTPYSIIITPSGSKIPLVGAQNYSTLKQAIDALLSDVK